jgi:hypothetical protein
MFYDHFFKSGAEFFDLFGDVHGGEFNVFLFFVNQYQRMIDTDKRAMMPTSQAAVMRIISAGVSYWFMAYRVAEKEKLSNLFYAFLLLRYFTYPRRPGLGKFPRVS